MDEMNSSLSAVASPDHHDPPCIDIEVDVEVPIAAEAVATASVSSTLALENSSNSGVFGSMSTHIGSSLSLPPPAGACMPLCAINLGTVIKVFVAVTIIITVVLVTLVIALPRKDTSNRWCKATLYVSNEGKSDYRTISEAVEAAPSYSPFKICIIVRAGEYQEIVRIGFEKTNLSLIGEGIQKTTITSNASLYEATTENWQVATLRVGGQDFSARDLTITNTGKYGVAVDNWADSSVFFRCKFKGTNMTLYAKGEKQFYRRCYFYGTSYLITGAAASFFQKCDLFSTEKSHSKEKIVFSGQTREFFTYEVGFTFHLCTFHITGSSLNDSGQVFLGRTLGDYASIIIMQSYLDPSITGYIIDSPPNTTYLAIFDNTGQTMKSLPRFVHVLDDEEAQSQFSLRAFLSEGNWIGPGVEYDLDLAK